MASDSLPPRSAGSPPSAGLLLSSARTCRGTPTASSELSSRHWKGWATALRQEYSRRPELATPCDASDCSSWLSPMVGCYGTDSYNAAGNSDFSRKAMELGERLIEEMWSAPRTITGGAESAERKKELGRENSGGGDLQAQVQQWEAPSVAVSDGTRMTRGGDRSDELLLTGQAVAASENWSSPKASDPEKAGPNMRGSKGDVPLPSQAVKACGSLTWPAPASRDHKGSSDTSLIRQDGKVRSDMLDYAAEQFFHPPSSPDRPIAGGSTSSTDSPNSNQPSAKRKLNPIFVEALMRWPTGLSGFERPAMALTLWSLQQRGFLSALYSTPTEEPAQGMLL